jgi:uncharacterized protein (TIGR04168 family)
MTNKVRIAIIGDVHQEFDLMDIQYFNGSGYDLLLFVGDLSNLNTSSQSLKMAADLSKLRKPALFIPGNHDVHNVFQIISEILQLSWLMRFTGIRHRKHHYKLMDELAPVEFGGFSNHPYSFNGISIDVIAARPYAMGGSSLSFTPLLKQVFHLKTLDESSRLLMKQVDSTVSDNLIFLAHNGPYGLSDSPTGIWGCDFDPAFGDFGDRDLTDAIDYAKSQGKRILAVIAGHMHLQTYLGPKPLWKRRGAPGPLRPWLVEKAGVKYVNAALVPRIYQKEGETVHHHICLEFDGLDLELSEKSIAS